MPPGTVVRAPSPEASSLGELLEADARLVVARGGRGGRGNVHFASATHRAPKHAEKGTPGEERWIELELKLIADIGLVGAPNAGKSTLLAALTEARPEVGAYPFTTISPTSASWRSTTERTAVIADVPGLIEGAHEGRGLGHHFLRHVERTRVIVGVVDGAAREPIEEWQAVADELRLHDPALLDRPMPLVVTKLDLPEVRDAMAGAAAASLRGRAEPSAVSAHDGTGLDELRARSPRRSTGRERRRPMSDGRRGDASPSLRSARGGLGGGRRGRRPARPRPPHRDRRRPHRFRERESRDRFWRLLERLGIDLELRRRGRRARGRPSASVAVELEWGDEE